MGIWKMTAVFQKWHVLFLESYGSHADVAPVDFPGLYRRPKNARLPGTGTFQVQVQVEGVRVSSLQVKIPRRTLWHTTYSSTLRRQPKQGIQRERKRSPEVGYLGDEGDEDSDYLCHPPRKRVARSSCAFLVFYFEIKLSDQICKKITNVAAHTRAVTRPQTDLELSFHLGQPLPPA
jgi:hypothetical protein